MQPGLSFDQAPPLAAPMRFFLTAPLFGILAAGLALWQGSEVMVSRWAPPALALTHVLTLGFMAMCMLGALLQMLPVVVGSAVGHPLWLARIVHLLVSTGTLALTLGLVALSPAWLLSAQFLLAGGFGIFLAVAGYSALHAPVKTPQSVAVGLALCALAATVILGIALVSGLRGTSMPLQQLANIHVAWGLLGWTALLVIGVALQVVPMLQMTPPYPRSMQRWVPALLCAALIVWSAVAIWLPDLAWLRLGVEVAVAATIVAFALVTLRLQQRRKRRLPDPTLRLWRAAMSSLIACVVLWAGATISPKLGETHAMPLLVGVLLVLGFAVSLINAMIYKIVPFLVSFHLQSLGVGFSGIPTMKQIVPDAAVRLQGWLHLCALALTLAACLWPPLMYVAAPGLALSFGWLFRNMLMSWRMFLVKRAELLGRAGAKPGA